MRYLTILLSLFCQLIAQDSLITTSGIAYQGKFIEIKGTYVFFQAEGSPIPQGIPSTKVQKIILEDGSVIDQAELEIRVANLAEKQPEIQAKSLELRRTEALEKIATAQTYFMYYSITVTGLTILLVLASQ